MATKSDLAVNVSLDTTAMEEHAREVAAAWLAFADSLAAARAE